MTVADNIAFPLKMAKKTREIQKQVSKLLEDVRQAQFGNRFRMNYLVVSASAVARACANRPRRLLLLDEPLSALDAKLREQMQIERSICRRKSALPSSTLRTIRVRRWRCRTGSQ